MRRTNHLLAALFLALSALGQNGLSFDGLNDRCAGMPPGPAGNTARTVEAWMNQSAIDGAQEVIVSWGSMSISERFTLNIIDGFPRIEVGGSGFSSPAPLMAGTWYHLAATYHPTQSPPLKLYVDGVLKASGTPTVPVQTAATGGIVVGVRNDSINFFNGRIDEVRVWNIARTQAEILSTKDVEFCVVPPQLVTYYPMNQGMAGGANAGLTTVPDFSAQNNDGTLIGFALSGATSNWVAGAPVNTSESASDDVVRCSSYTSPGGNIYTSSGTYLDTLVGGTGCPLYLTTELTITPLDTGVTVSGITLVAEAIGVSYQWVDCGNGQAPIANATASSYTAASNGSYAVIVSGSTCTDTSACYAISGVGIGEYTYDARLRAYPVPTTDVLYLSGIDDLIGGTYRIVDALGAERRTGTCLDLHDGLPVGDLAPGIYQLLLDLGSRHVRVPWLKR